MISNDIQRSTLIFVANTPIFLMLVSPKEIVEI